jgi:two-component system, OmpR family, response regulator ResD
MNSRERGRILVVDDDNTVSEILSRYLAREGYAVDKAGTGEDALEQARSRPPDLIVLDLMLPGLSGFDVCRRVRKTSGIPIIMLTARGEEGERVFGLRLGADDYVVKPFSPRELAARIDSVLRRTAASHVRPGERRQIDNGSLALDLQARTLTVDGALVDLTAREFDLLSFLASRPNEVFSRAQLLEAVWGYTVGDAATVTVHVRRLRGKIEPNPAEPRYIETVWGIGYRFQP